MVGCRHRVSLLRIHGAIVLLVTGMAWGAVPGPPTGLRVNYAYDPVIDTPRPLFSWIVNDTDRGEVQAAYQLIVSTTRARCEANHGDVWDTGRIDASAQNDVRYGGAALVSRQSCWWKVRTWDKDNQAGLWSEPATFEMALLEPADWTAHWIGGDFERYRTEFSLPTGKPIAKARANISAKEIFDLHLNGTRQGGDRVMEPGTSVFAKRMRYCTYDVTEAVRTGPNAVGVSVGRGRMGHWWLTSADRDFILQLEVHHTDGSCTRIVSDRGNWKATARGPLIPLPPNKSELYQGETYDARNEDAWTVPGYDDRGWSGVKTERPAGSGRLCAQVTPPMKAGGLIAPVAMTEPRPGVYVFDIGQKISGWSRLALDGPRGSTVTLRHAEKLLGPGAWDDYALTLNARIVQGAAGVRFRIADDRNYYLLQLLADGTLQLSRKVDGVLTVLKRVPAEIRTGVTYAVRIEASGHLIKTSIDGRLRDATEDQTFASGKVGFHQEAGETATFDRIFVASLHPPDPTKPSRQTPRHLLRDGTRDPGLWVNRDNLMTATVTPDPKEPKSTFRQFTLTDNRTCESYDGGTRGRVDPSNLHVFGSRYFADATDRYTLRGGGPEVWEPRITMHGFQFVEVTGYPGVPTLHSIRARPAHQAVDGNPGRFSCSDPLLNKLHSAFTWTLLNSLQFGMPVDCDQRDERTGWTGDAHAYSQAANYNYDMLNFYDSWLTDLQDTQIESGQINKVAPIQDLTGIGKRPGDTVWLSAYVSIPWDTYLATGSKSLLAKRYDSIKALVDYLRTDQVTNRIDAKGGLVNWATQPFGSEAGTRPDFGGTAYLFQCVDQLARMAEALGRADDAGFYRAEAQAIRDAFNGKFLVGNTNYAGTRPGTAPSQTALAIALDLGLCPPAARTNVALHLVEAIQRNGNRLHTGVAGTKSLLAALCENGAEETAFALATQTNYPSWGRWIADGLTSCCEHWDDHHSRGHAYLAGSLDAYFFRYLAGIAPTKPGYEEFQIMPHVKNGLTNVAAVVNTVRGTLSSEWSKPDNRHFSLRVTVPVNTRATVFVPTLGMDPAQVVVTEGGSPIWDRGERIHRVDGILFQATQGPYLVWSVGSGRYTFDMKP